jgi:endonuclease YncB( thermonuclease family)
MARFASTRVAVLVLASIGIAFGVRDAPAEPVLVGTVIHVYDGDTIKVQLESGPIVVRLHSIDAPEHDQPWGPEATGALASLIQGRQVSLAVITQDSYDRLVADVMLGEDSVNAWMVQHGDAWAYRHYLEDSRYCAWEGAARASRRGLWSLPPDSWRAPWQWRALGRGEVVTYTDYRNETVEQCVAAMPVPVPTSGTSTSPAEASAPTANAAVPAGPPGSCQIKGNIGSNGRIYHVPGSAAYDRTQIDESRGERWFCTEAEARAAGWRPPAGQ